MRKAPKNSIDYYILPNKIFCNAIGLWPHDEGSISKSLFSGFRIVFSVMAVGTICVPGFMLIGEKWGDLETLTGVGCVSTTLMQVIFKMIYLALTREKSCRLYKELKSLWNSSDDPKDRQCYENLAYWARTITIAAYVCGMSTVTMFITSATIDYIHSDQMDNGDSNGRHLPYDVWYGTDITESPTFEIAFVCQVLAAYISALGISGVDTTCMTIILHVCGHFRLVSRWISNIGNEINCQLTNYLTDCPPSLTAKLVRCIRHHQRLIHVVRDLNSLLTSIVFMQLLTSGIELCLSGFAVLGNGASGDLLKFVFYLTSMLSQLLLWCWPGEILIQESQEVGQSVYLNLPWYKLPPNYRRYLLLMVLRSQKHCRISALTFQALSIHTLTTIFNTAASGFTLLRQVQEEAISKNDIIM